MVDALGRWTAMLVIVCGMLFIVCYLFVYYTGIVMFI